MVQTANVARTASGDQGTMTTPNPFLPPAYEHLGLQRFQDVSGSDRDQDNLNATQAGTSSALQGLTVQQILDLDAENFAITIDKHQSQAKKAILDHFMEVKTRMTMARNSAVDEESRAAGLRLSAKQAEIDLLRFELNQSTSRVNKLTEVLRRMAGSYDTVKHQKRCQGLQIQVFYAWRQRALSRRQRATRLQRGLYWYHVVHLQRNVLRAWFKVSQQLHKGTLAQQHQHSLTTERASLTAACAAQTESLKHQLSEALVLLAREQEVREKLEEDMKQAFMRGVCALNIEAMSIMKRGAPPSGVNPFPVRPAAAAPAPVQPASQQGGPGAYTSQPVPTPTAAPASSTSAPPVRLQADLISSTPAAPGGASKVWVSPGAGMASRASGGGAPSGQHPAAGPGQLGGSQARAPGQVVVERGGVAGELPQPRAAPAIPGPLSRDRSHPLARN